MATTISNTRQLLSVSTTVGELTLVGQVKLADNNALIAITAQINRNRHRGCRNIRHSGDQATRHDHRSAEGYSNNKSGHCKMITVKKT